MAERRPTHVEELAEAHALGAHLEEQDARLRQALVVLGRIQLEIENLLSRVAALESMRQSALREARRHHARAIGRHRSSE